MFCRVSQNLLNIIVTVKNRRAKNKPFKTLRQKRSILLFDTDFKYISSLISEPSAAASAITRIRLPLCCSSNFTIPLFPLELIHSRSWSSVAFLKTEDPTCCLQRLQYHTEMLIYHFWNVLIYLLELRFCTILWIFLIASILYGICANGSLVTRT